MRSRLFWKLFLLQLIAAAAVLAGALWVSRAYSLKGFAEFLETREHQRVQRIAGELAQASRQGTDLVQAFEALRPAPPVPAVPPVPPAPPIEPTPPTPPEDARPPPHHPHFMIRKFVGEPPPPPLQLLDAQGNYLGGDHRPLPAEPEREPIEVDGNVVGYLAWPKLPMPEHMEFAHKQARHIGVIATVGLLVAALFALLTTALIVRPIRALSAGTAALSRREFGTRLDERRRDELGALAADFNRLAAALEGYDARQRQWLADVAHELRTPLSVLRGEVEAVLDGVRPVGPETMRSLKQEVGRLEALIQDLQLVSLAESGGLRLNRADTDLGELARGSVERFAESLGGRGFKVALALESGLRVSVDAQRLEQVLGNLLGNVLAHASPPGPITLAAHREGERVVLSVADAGPGVPLEALPRLFDRLYRAQSARTRASGGAGLGLSICKSIVEAHGGTIAAQRSADGGLEIVIRL